MKNKLNEITTIPLNLKKSIFKANYENIIKPINNKNIKNFEFKKNNDLKISINIIFNIIIIQHWWKKLFFIIKIQKNIRGYFMRKKCIQKLEKDYYFISLLVNITLLYKKIWSKRIFKTIIKKIERRKQLSHIIKIYNKKILKKNFKKWKHIINIIKNNENKLYEGIKMLIQIMKKKTLIFDLTNIFQYIYGINNTSIKTISKSGNVYSIYNPTENSNSNLSIQYISEQKGSQGLNYESDKSKISDCISSSNISSIHSMNFMNNNSNILISNNNISNLISNNILYSNYSITQTQNTINSFKLSENNSIKNNNNYYITQKTENNIDEKNENYFKLLYDKININSINHQKKNNKFQNIYTIIYQYFHNWKNLNYSNKDEFHEILKRMKNNKIKDKLNNCFILWKYNSNKNSTIYNQLLTTYKKTKTRKIVIHPQIIGRKNINNQIKKNNCVIKNELLSNALIKWNIKNKSHQTKLTIFKKSIIKSLIQLNNNNDKINYVKKKNNNLIKEKIINCFYNILSLYKIKNAKLFLNKLFNQNKNLIFMKNEKNENLKNQREVSQNKKKELDNYSNGKKLEKDKNKEEPKKSQRTLVFRFKKKNQINSRTFNVITPEKNNKEQENFINENYEMMKNQMEKKNTSKDINLTTPQKKYKSMKKRNNLYIKNLNNSSYIEKELVTIIKTENGYVKKLNISKKKDNKHNYYKYDKLCKTEETFKKKTKNKIRDNLNLEYNQNISNIRYTMKNKVSISPILKENRKSEFQIKPFEKNENNNQINNSLKDSLNLENRNNIKNVNKRRNTDDFLNLSENDNYNNNDNNFNNLSFNKFIDNKKKNENQNNNNIEGIILKKIISIYRRFTLKKVIKRWKIIKNQLSSRNTSPFVIKNVFINKSNIIKDNHGINKIKEEKNKVKNKVSIVKKISNINMLTNRTLSLSPDNIKKYIKTTEQKSLSKSSLQINKTEKNENSKEKNKNVFNLIHDLQKKINNIPNENLNQIHTIKDNALEVNNSKQENKINEDKYNKEIENISNYHPPQKIKEIVIENLNLNKQIIKEKEEQREMEKTMRFNRSLGSINQSSDLYLNNFDFENNDKINNKNNLRKYNSTEVVEQYDFFNNKNFSHNQIEKKKTNSSKNLSQYNLPHSGMIFTKKTIPNSENQLFYSNSISNFNDNKNPYLNNPFNLKSNITNHTSPNQNNNFTNKIYMKRHPKNINKSYNNQQNSNTIIKESNSNNIKYPYTINNNIITNNITFSNPYNFFTNEIPKREKEHLQTVQSETITSSNNNTISVSSSYNNTISGISLIENHNEKLNSIKYTSQSFVVSKDIKNNIQNKNISLIKNPMKMKGNFEDLIENDYNNLYNKTQRIQITNAQYPINNIITNKDDMKIDSKESRNYIMEKIIEKCDNDIYSSKNNEQIKMKNKHKKHFSISFPIKEDKTKFVFHNLVGERNKNDSNKFELIQESKMLINSHSANNINLKRPFSPNSNRINKIEYKPLKITYKLKELNTNQYYHTSRENDENKLLQDKKDCLEIMQKPYVYSIIKKSLNREKKNNYFSKKLLPLNSISQSPVQNRKNILSILNNNLDK